MAENIGEEKDYLPRIPVQKVTEPNRTLDDNSIAAENVQGSHRLLPPI